MTGIIWCLYVFFFFVCFANLSKHHLSLSFSLRVCVCVCVCESVKRAAGDKELQRHSSANECKLLWQPRRVTPSVSSLLNQPHFLFSFSLLFSTLSVSMAIHTLPTSSLSLAVTPFSSLVCSLVFPVFRLFSPSPQPVTPCRRHLGTSYLLRGRQEDEPEIIPPSVNMPFSSLCQAR